ncbi:hypothetical protein D3C71_1110230 [compost metagenome]
MQALVVGRFGHGGEPACGVGQIRGHGPQGDFVAHLTLLLGRQCQCLRVLRQLLLGGVRVGLGEFLQAIGGDAAAAFVLRPVQGARVGFVDEGGVIVGLRQLGGGQAACGRTHHRRLLGIGSGVDALPAQCRRQPAATGQYCEHRIAGIGQRLAAAAPQRLCIAGPLRIGLAGGLVRVEFGATHAGIVAGLPVGQQRRPILAACQCGQPGGAEGFGDGLALVALEEILRLHVAQGVDVAAQGAVLQPAVQRVVVQRRGGVRIELAALGIVDGRTHGRALRIQVLGGSGAAGKHSECGQWHQGKLFHGRSITAAASTAEQQSDYCMNGAGLWRHTSRICLMAASVCLHPNPSP